MEISRRAALRRGVLATGVVVGGGLTTRTVLARGARGGAGFIIDHDYQDVAQGERFQITGPVTKGNPHWKLLTAPTCNGNAPPKEYRGYRFDLGGSVIGNIYLEPERTVSTADGHWYEVVQAHECQTGTTQESGRDWSTVWKVSYKPATQPQSDDASASGVISLNADAN